MRFQRKPIKRKYLAVLEQRTLSGQRRARRVVVEAESINVASNLADSKRRLPERVVMVREFGH